MKEYRCPNQKCNALLFKSRGFGGDIEIKCHKCDTVQTIAGDAIPCTAPTETANIGGASQVYLDFFGGVRK